MCRVPPAKRGNHARPAAGPQGLLCPGFLTPQAARNHLAMPNAPLKQRNSQTNVTPRATAPPPNTRTGPAVTKAADAALTRRAAAEPASVGCPKHHMLPLSNTHGRDLVWMNPHVPQVRAHTPATGALLRA